MGNNRIGMVETNINVPVPVSQTSESHAMLSVIERVALDPAIDIAKLEKMLDMQERILNRNAKQAFMADFATMQAELPEIAERGESHNKQKYATLEDINEAVKPILQKHGFGVSFRVKQNGHIIVTGILSHREGHSEETEMMLPADNSGSKNAVQAIGSTVSYGKRYVLCALLNISTRKEDDDGNGGAVSNEQAVEIDLLMRKVKADKARFLKFMGVEDVRDIRACDYQKAMNSLNSKKAEP